MNIFNLVVSAALCRHIFSFINGLFHLQTNGIITASCSCLHSKNRRMFDDQSNRYKNSTRVLHENKMAAYLATVRRLNFKETGGLP